MRKTNQKQQADRLFAQVIKKAGTCHCCGSQDNLTCAHIFSRRFMGTRYDLNNAVVLCLKDHRYYTDNPKEWLQWCVDYLGEGGYDELYAKAHQIIKIDFDEVITYLKGLL